MAASNQSKPSWDAFDKIFDEAFSRTKSTANRPYFSPTPFTPYPPTEYEYEPTFAAFHSHSGRNSGHDGDHADFHLHSHDHRFDEDEPYGLPDDDFYSRADMEYYEDDDYEKAFWTRRARKAQATGSGNSGSRKMDALELTGVGTGFGSGVLEANVRPELTTGGTTFSKSQSQPSIVPQRLQPDVPSQPVSHPRPAVATGGSGVSNSAAGNPLANAMTAFSAAAAAINGLTNSLNGLGLGPNASGGPSAPRAAAPIVTQVPTLAQPRPPIRKPPPPLNLEDSSSGSGSASSSSLDPASPFKLSPGPSPPVAPAPAQFQPQLQPQLQSQFQFQQYQFQPESQFPTSRSMFLQQQQQQQAQVHPKGQSQATTTPGQKERQEQGKSQTQAPAPVSAQSRPQTQPIPVPAVSRASAQAASQESQSRSLDWGMGMGITLMSPPSRSGVAGSLSTSPQPDSTGRDNPKSPTPSSSTVHKKRRPNPGKVTFRDSADGNSTTATFDMQGVKKSDVHVSYQNDKVVVSWETVTVEDKLEDGKIVRERRERKYVRTLPLPEGTKFTQVKASMDGRYLHLTHPKFK